MKSSSDGVFVLGTTRERLGGHGRDGARVGVKVRTTAGLCLLVLGVAGCTGVRGGPMHDVQHVSVSIARRPGEVYEFASDPRNLPAWAAGLARSEVRQD